MTTGDGGSGDEGDNAVMLDGNWEAKVVRGVGGGVRSGVEASATS